MGLVITSFISESIKGDNMAPEAFFLGGRKGRGSPKWKHTQNHLRNEKRALRVGFPWGRDKNIHAW